jgi:hypothetical protein
MTQKISLYIKDSSIKEAFFESLKSANVPICKNCDKLFGLGFPNTEEGLCDYLIAVENLLICECEYSKLVENLFKEKNDGLVDISNYYKGIK